MTKFLMIQGTSSNAGKSSLVAAFCRILSDKGYMVAPLKAQNMSSNVYITKDGLEMAKAQAVQAIAARTEPSVYMNPILLKPLGDYISRVVLHGRVYRDMHAKHYYNSFVTRKAMRYLKTAIKELSPYDVVVIEGAGSPAEINIMDYDIANMKLAEMLDAPVLIVADIERGGCFASMAGTMSLLKRKHRRLVKGFIINKFRGDKSVLDPGIKQIEEIVKKPVLGIIPYVDQMFLPNEDSLGMKLGSSKENKINIAVVRYPNAINITDLDPLLRSSDGINPYYVTSNKLSDADLVILPASRDLVSDLEWMKQSGVASGLKSLKKSRPIIGICEGFVMMGTEISIRGVKIKGLGVVDIRSYHAKALAGNVMFRVKPSRTTIPNGTMMTGYLRRDYRITYGRNAHPMFRISGFQGRPRRFQDGAVSASGLVMGCNIYGLFDAPVLRNDLVDYLARVNKMSVKTSGMEASELWDQQIQAFSDVVRRNTDIEYITKLVGL
jgi:adenosylcobyric acid synthase